MSNDEAILSPVAMLTLARRFGAAAKALQGDLYVGSSHHPVPHYLYGHAIELALKAFLVAEGWTETALKKKVGHDLASALSKADSMGLKNYVSLTAAEAAAVRALNVSYSKKELEYAAKTYSGGRLVSYPSTRHLESAANKLWMGLRAPCLKALKALRGSTM